MRKIFLFTSSFPYGKGENWINTEVLILSKRFDITIIPLYAEKGDVPQWQLDDQIKVLKPLFSTLPLKGAASLRYLHRLFNYRELPAYISELNDKRVLMSRSRLYKFLQFIQLGKKVQSHPVVRQLMESDLKPLYYFFWGMGASQMVPFLNRKAFRNGIAVRMHGYDLYEFRNSNYIPFRNILLKNADIILTVSEDGKNYLTEKYPASKQKIIVARLGTIGRGLARKSSDGILHLFSCSSLIALKRVHLIAEALLKITDISVIWTHLGDGPELERVMEIARHFPPNIKFDFRGHVQPDEVGTIYANSNADLFLHVSETEGVPVAIMEALAAGIPVYATNVGGVAEIVDETIGQLLPADIETDKLALSITSYFKLEEKLKEQFRINAANRYRQMCDARFNAEKLSELLVSL